MAEPTLQEVADFLERKARFWETRHPMDRSYDAGFWSGMMNAAIDVQLMADGAISSEDLTREMSDAEWEALELTSTEQKLVGFFRSIKNVLPGSWSRGQ